MKRIIITSALLVFAAAGFSQQRPEAKRPTPEQIAQREANSLSERLSLTEDQRSGAYSVYLDRAKKQQTERDARMKEMQKQRDENIAQVKQQDERISQLLNEDQKKTYQQLQRQRPAVPGAARMNRPGPQGRFGFRQDIRRHRLLRPGAPYSGFQSAPQRQFQQRSRGFQQRPGIKNNFRKVPDVRAPRSQFNRRPQDRNLKNAPQRFQSRPDSLQRPQRRMPASPGNIQSKSEDKI